MKLVEGQKENKVPSEVIKSILELLGSTAEDEDCEDFFGFRDSDFQSVGMDRKRQLPPRQYGAASRVPL
jgi:hypothetical protein